MVVIKDDIGGVNVITSTITGGDADELGPADGKQVDAIVKASEVMIATHRSSERVDRHPCSPTLLVVLAPLQTLSFRPS